MPAKILLIDDEPAMTRTLAPILRAQGYECQIAADASEALRHARLVAYDLALLDLGLPDADGKEIIGQLSELNCRAVVVLSARMQEGEKVAALDRGAADYLSKPFGLDELLARIRVALRCSSGRDLPERMSLGNGVFLIDFAARRVTVEGQKVKLSPIEYRILECLSRNAGQIVTRRQLMISVWSMPTDDDQKLRVYLSHLRKKIRQKGGENLIVNEAGVGYMLVC